jgi:hypothetical protein
MVIGGRMLRKIFGPKREEVRAGFGNLSTEDFHVLNSSPNITRVVKSRTIRWVGDLARMGKKDVCSVMVGKPEERRHLEDLSVHWSIILKWIIKK